MNFDTTLIQQHAMQLSGVRNKHIGLDVAYTYLTLLMDGLSDEPKLYGHLQDAVEKVEQMNTLRTNGRLTPLSVSLEPDISGCVNLGGLAFDIAQSIKEWIPEGLGSPHRPLAMAAHYALLTTLVDDHDTDQWDMLVGEVGYHHSMANGVSP